MKVDLSFLASTACALWLAIPLTAANAPAADANNRKNMTAATATRSAWPPDTLSGKISMVDPDRKLVVVETPDGIPFDLVLTTRTRIKSGDRAITLKDLTGDTNKTVSVKFIPERRGDVARSIEIGG